MDLEFIVSCAKETLLTVGEHRPVVLIEIEGEATPAICSFADFPFTTTEGREKGMFVAGRRFARKHRKHLKGHAVSHLAFACEGWGRAVSPGTPFVRPSQAADRKEVLIVVLLDVRTMQQQSMMYEMVRTSDALDLLSMGMPDGTKSSLLPAFLVGLQTAQQDEGMARARLRRVCKEYGVYAS